ncbi:MAG: hypothetical protein RJS98_13635 [Rhodospirillaceae bacterium]
MTERTIENCLAEAQELEGLGNWIEAISLRAEAVIEKADMTIRAAVPREPYPNNDLEVLGETHLPTKRRHDYLQHYWRHLQHFRESARKVVEIGVQTPRSVKTWAEFFPNAIIYGIDIDEKCREFSEDRIDIHIGDQMDEKFLLDFVEKTGGDFDVVIDDGLHTPYSILRSFSYLYPALQDHGIYVIEDVQRQPETLNFINYLISCVNYYPDDVSLSEWPGLSEFEQNLPWSIHNTVGVSCYRYITFINRGFNPRDNKFLIPLEEFRAKKDEQMDATIAEMKAKNIAITRESLRAHLHPNNVPHINRLIDRLDQEDKT